MTYNYVTKTSLVKIAQEIERLYHMRCYVSQYHDMNQMRVEKDGYWTCMLVTADDYNKTDALIKIDVNPGVSSMPLCGKTVSIKNDHNAYWHLKAWIDYLSGDAGFPDEIFPRCICKEGWHKQCPIDSGCYGCIYEKLDKPFNRRAQAGLLGALVTFQVRCRSCGEVHSPDDDTEVRLTCKKGSGRGGFSHVSCKGKMDIVIDKTELSERIAEAYPCIKEGKVWSFPIYQTPATPTLYQRIKALLRGSF